MNYTTNYTIIGMRIKNERLKFNLSQEKFAELINLSAVFIGQIERGERKMSIETLIKISTHLHVSTDYLIFGNTNKSDNFNNKNKLYELISHCSDKQVKLIGDIIKSILPYIC
ncbi:MAG: helix-turn-helix transcriptional regulator [Clostridium sp.]|nr:helix-turn-helix transcriptional regulator [Clostridium sp.]